MDDVLYRHERIDRARLKALQRRSDVAGLLQLSGHVALLGCTGWAVVAARGGVLVVPAIVAHGFVMIFLFAPLHETIHRTAFRSRSLNQVVAWMCGAVLVLPPEYFRAFHFAHHRHTQDPERDPELSSPKPACRRQWLVYVSGIPYWMAQVRSTIGHALGRTAESFLTARSAGLVVREARVLLAVYAGLAVSVVAFGTWLPVMLWLLPVVVGQPFLRLYLMAEHMLCPQVPDLLRNTRTTISNRLVRFLAWNMPFHAEHHAYPSVPFHALREVHRDIGVDLAVVDTGYVSVQRQIVATL